MAQVNTEGTVFEIEIGQASTWAEVHYLNFSWGPSVVPQKGMTSPEVRAVHSILQQDLHIYRTIGGSHSLVSSFDGSVPVSLSATEGRPGCRGSTTVTVSIDNSGHSLAVGSLVVEFIFTIHQWKRATTRPVSLIVAAKESFQWMLQRMTSSEV